MKYRLTAVLALLITGAASGAIAPPAAAAPAQTARVMYARALAEDHALRDESSKPTLAQIHRAIAMYEAVVRKHPASGYCDDALWQGGNLAQLAFERFGSEADQKKAMHLFAMLVKEYPTSKFVKSARAALASAPAVPAAPAAGAAATPAVGVSASAAAGISAPPPPAPSVDTNAPQSDPDPGRSPDPPAKLKSPAEGQKRSSPALAGVTALKDVRRTALSDGVRVTVDLDAEVAYHQEEIANPRRLFFDLKGVKAAPNLQDVTLRFDGDIVKEVRLGRHPQNTTRVVVDLEGVAGYTVYPLYSPYRLVIDLQRATATAAHEAVSQTTAAVSQTTAAVPQTAGAVPQTAAWVHEPAPQKMTVRRGRSSPVSTAGTSAAKPFTPPALTVDTKAPSAGIAVSQIKPPVQPPPTALPVVDVEPDPEIVSTDAPTSAKEAGSKTTVPVQPSANMNGKFSLSRQLGLGVSRIVIDAGHGGHDPGARGNGINEAELTLDVALRLQKLLAKQPGFEVVMTRDTDEFIPLQERTAIANREGADLFLSIHANASRNPQARGIETYFLNFAMNPEAEAVAARENAASGQAMHSLPDIVKAIALNNKINESRDFAATVQKSMAKRLGTKNHALKDLGVKQAPFVVLIGASMPSVLAEISFVTNKQDGSLLKTQAYRQQIAQALFEAVQNYQQGLHRNNPVSGKKATTQ